MQKSLFKSKGKMAGFLLMISAVLKVLATWQVTQEDVMMFLTGLGIFGIRDAIRR